MPAYAYRAVDASGRTRRGRLEAATPAALSRSLEANGLLLVDATDAGTATSRGRSFGPARRRSVLEVTQALASLLPAGMPLSSALATASELASGDVQAALAEIRGRVEGGESVALALARFPELFTPLYVGMIRAGERSGDLGGAFARLAGQLEREDELRGRMLSAAIYPLVLATIGGAAVVVLLLFVIPRFAELLEGAGASLPVSTALLLSVASGIRRFWPVLVGASVVTLLGGALAARGEWGRRAGSHLLLTVPGVRGLRQAVLAARFSRLTGVLLGGGAPLLSALDDALESLGDPLARDEVARIRSRVREGTSLHGAITEGSLFPPLLARLVAVGEGAGRLREFLLKAADLFDDRSQRTVQRLVALAEPAMIVFFGAVVAFVALSLLQAIYGVNADAFR